MAARETFGNIRLFVPQASISAGQDLAGAVNLCVIRPFPVKSLVLKFKGKEFAEWTVVSTRTTGEQEVTDIDVNTGNRYVCVRKFPIHSFDGGMATIGKFCFPFRFALPKKLPSSFLAESRMNKGKVYYHLSASLDQCGEIRRAKITLNVTNAISTAPLEEEVSASIRSCCCFAKGRVRLRAMANKNAYELKETIEIQAQADTSESSVAVKQIKAKLLRSIKMRADTGSVHGHHTTVSRAETPVSIPAGQQTNSSAVNTLQLPVQGTDDMATATSVAGVCLECCFKVRVKAVVNGCLLCCGQTPTVEREVLVFSSDVPLTEIGELQPAADSVTFPLASYADDNQHDVTDNSKYEALYRWDVPA